MKQDHFSFSQPHGSRSAPGVLRILHDQRGNIMPMAAIAMIAMAGMVGGGVDISRAYMVQNRLQNACDAGVLAGRRSIDDNGFDTNAEAQADRYFDTNFDQGIEGTTSTAFTPTATDNDNTVNGVATTTLDTAVMRLFGFETIDLSASCTASMAIGNSDIIMVLDTTGSMACTAAMSSDACGRYINGNPAGDVYNETNHGGVSRLSELKTAMKGFFDTVDTARQSSNARIRYGFTPYSSSVNVGRLITAVDPNYLVNNWTYHTRKASFETNTVEERQGWENPVRTTDESYGATTAGSWYYYGNSGYYYNRSCENALPDNTAWSNHGGEEDQYSQVINAEGQRVTTNSEVQRERRRRYTCFQHRNGYHYRIRRWEYRDYNVSVIDTEDPIIVTTETEDFTGWSYYARQMPADVFQNFKTFNPVSTKTGDDGTFETSTWSGCIEERGTVASGSVSYSAFGGMEPSGAHDLDIDGIPNAAEPATQWRPIWDQISYRRTNRWGRTIDDKTSDNGRAMRTNCPIEAKALSALSESQFDQYADSLKPAGGTYHDIGMIWGTRMISPDGIFSATTDVNPENNGAVSRHIIFMTDGFMSTSNSTYSAYGFERYDQRVTNDGSSSQNNRHIDRFLAVCGAARAKGIRVWVIAFASELTAELQNCASTDSAFPAENSSDLNTAFQEIANTVGELRVVQ